jgi:hypothetical protein
MDPIPPASPPPYPPPQPTFEPPKFPPPLPPRPPSPPPPEDIAVWPVFRDIAIVFALTFFGGCLVGFYKGATKSDPAGAVIAVAISNLICGTIAFTISGVLAPPPRWRHLFFVALGSWLLSIINVLAFGVSVQQWLVGAVAMAVVMGAGGGLSYLFKADRPRSH